MGVRAIMRDVLGIYLGFEIMKGAVFGKFEISLWVLIAGIILFIFGIWFLLERVGIIPKITGGGYS